MTRDEVTAIRLYFARSVDRYIERRRVMIRASQRLRNAAATSDTTTSPSSSPTRSRYIFDKRGYFHDSTMLQ